MVGKDANQLHSKRMAKTILILTLLIISLNHFATAQPPEWQWAKSAGGNSADYINGISTDANGNVYVTGIFDSPNITFGGLILLNADGTKKNQDFFIVKYDPDGNVIWGHSAGSVGYDECSGVCTDADGNVYITGYFSDSSITFGTTTLTNTNANASEIFAVKYNSSGDVLWVRSVGSGGYTYGSAVCTDNSGNVIITGYYSGDSITFGSTTLINTSESYDIFTAKYDPSGNVIWASGGGGTVMDFTTGICTDNGGNIFITGYSDSPAITFATTVLANKGGNDIFIVKYSPSGNMLWAKPINGFDNETSSGICADNSGNVFVTGDFDSRTINLGTTTLNNRGILNIFTCKLTPDGNVLWSNHTGGSGLDHSTDICTDKNGNVFITGGLSPGGQATDPFTNALKQNIFIVKYDPSGNGLWTISAGGDSGEAGQGICTDDHGDVIIAGCFNSPEIVFGTTTITNNGITKHDNIFIAKLDGRSGGEKTTDPFEISVAPNPFALETIITFRDDQKNTIIKFMNALGQEVKNINFSGKQLIFEREGLSAGLYFLQAIDQAKNMINKKIIIR